MKYLLAITIGLLLAFDVAAAQQSVASAWIVPSASADTYGTAVVVTTNGGMTAKNLYASVTSGGAETLTLGLTPTYDDLSTGAEQTQTISSGTTINQVLDTYCFYTDSLGTCTLLVGSVFLVSGKAVASLSFRVKSSISSSTAYLTVNGVLY